MFRERDGAGTDNILYHKNMHLIVGLGNLGEQYKGTRHNIGRETVAAFGARLNFDDFSSDKKANALIAEGKLGKEKTVLALPETFMNKSGSAVKQLAKNFKVKSKNCFVVHDDADLPVGRMKVSFARNSAGHKGVESVMRALGTNEFYRMRIGIGGKKKTRDAMDIVLKMFSPNERLEIKKITKKAQEALVCAVSESPEKAMTLYNG